MVQENDSEEYFDDESVENTKETRLSGLDIARQRKQEMKEQGIAEIRRNPVEKSQDNPKSLRLAITAHCWECVGGEHSEKPKVLVRECGIVECSLHGLRPWQAKETIGESVGE